MLSPLSEFPYEQLRFAFAGSIVYPPGGKFGPRVQQDIQLVMLYSGEMTVTISGRPLHVKPGNVVLLKPGHEESFVFSKTEDTWHRWIAVHFDWLPERTSQALYELPEILPLSEEMNMLTDLMIHLLRQGSSNDADVRSLGLAAVQLYPRESVKAQLQTEKHPAVYAALAWVREHYSEDLKLTDLANASGVSSEHLVRLFKQHERTTPIQYLWHYRVNRAVELLTNTGLTVSEITSRCGFKTTHHLARLIKLATGRTATEIRKMSWSGFRKA